ncbi:methionyl-tRNA formyltransferase [Granulicella rosea]|uniref:Methionyl-tRNA formyltransferase n=1 Tax=Granulicella rosea TaxID=474952 RepID=A0A239INA4_9BACT|nr:methionyl-tRNA formyltransferase [Granulicella rosea]SNS93904.1 methionyl-tRNA formyltransferase [Granulicella rosea]
MKLVFCGTPEFAVPVLDAVIAAGHEVSLVVTQPDRAAGRGMETHISAVKAAALRHGLPIVQPEKIKNNLEFRAQLESLQPDAILVVAYGRIIPDWMLQLPRFGNINLHGSLLPKYRGAAPIQWAVANGETITGVTTMLLEAGLDTGPMLLAEKRAIAPEETAADLFESLAKVGARLMVKTLAGLACGEIEPVAQDHSQATLAPILTREDGRMDFDRTAQVLVNRWRGFQPWPGAFTNFRGKKLVVHSMKVSDARAVATGEFEVRDGHLLAGCGEGTVLELIEVQLEGKKRMSAADLLNGYQVKSGERLGL